MSSSVKSVSYDSKKRELTLEYVSGDRYLYENVPEDVHSGLVLAESKGKFVAANVRSKFTYRKL